MGAFGVMADLQFFPDPKRRQMRSIRMLLVSGKKTFPIFHLEQGDVCGLRANPCSGDRSLKSVGCDFSYAEVDIMALFTK